MWRPEGWVKHEDLIANYFTEPDRSRYLDGFEAGANAMLEVLREKGTPLENINKQEDFLIAMTDQLMMNLVDLPKGYLVFIPEEEDAV